MFYSFLFVLEFGFYVLMATLLLLTVTEFELVCATVFKATGMDIDAGAGAGSETVLGAEAETVLATWILDNRLFRLTL
jgi:hypothetical protein